VTRTPPLHICLVVLFLLFGPVGTVASADQDLPRLSAEAVAAALASSAPPLVLDVRGRGVAAEGTIAGAVNAGTDPSGFLPDGQDRQAFLLTPWPPAPELLTTWRQRLEAFGYAVSVVDGGFAAWRQAGLPVDIGRGRLIKPGSVPFTVPRGLCEANTPAQVFE